MALALAFQLLDQLVLPLTQTQFLALPYLAFLVYPYLALAWRLAFYPLMEPSFLVYPCPLALAWYPWMDLLDQLALRIQTQTQ